MSPTRRSAQTFRERKGSTRKVRNTRREVAAGRRALMTTKLESTRLQTKEATIVLQPQPHLTDEPTPELQHLAPVHLEGHNLLPARINNVDCTLYVDSGSTSCFMKYEVAKALGLVPQIKVVREVKL